MQQTPNARLFAAMSYVPFLWIAGMFVQPDKDDPLVRFHVNQGIILTIFGAIVSLLTKVFFLFGILNVASFVLFIIGIMNAFRSEMRPLPFIGGFILYK